MAHKKLQSQQELYGPSRALQQRLPEQQLEAPYEASRALQQRQSQRELHGPSRALQQRQPEQHLEVPYDVSRALRNKGLGPKLSTG